VNAIAIQWYDILMLAVLLAATAHGAWKGMAWQVASLAALLIGFAAAMRFSGPLAPWFGAHEPWNRFVAALILFLLTSMLIWMAFRQVSKFINRVKLQEWDKQVGALFGLVKGVFLCLALTFFAVTLSEPARQAVLRSHSGNWAAVLLRKAAPIVPEEVAAVVGRYLEEFQRKLDPATPPAVPFVPSGPPDPAPAGQGAPPA
jgi:membrane protein required for colicin V production